MADDLKVTECRDFGLATVMLRNGADPVAIGAALGLSMPAGPTCASGNGLTAIGTGPGSWLVFAPKAAPSWASDLVALPGASVSDQSGGYEILQLSGPAARTILQKGAFIDLDPQVFRPGSAATTVIAHIGVVIWQVDDPSIFHVALYRSFADSFHDWLRSVS